MVKSKHRFLSNYSLSNVAAEPRWVLNPTALLRLSERLSNIGVDTSWPQGSTSVALFSGSPALQPGKNQSTMPAQRCNLMSHTPIKSTLACSILLNFARSPGNCLPCSWPCAQSLITKTWAKEPCLPCMHQTPESNKSRTGLNVQCRRCRA